MWDFFFVMEYSSMLVQHPAFLTYLSVTLTSNSFPHCDSPKCPSIVWNAYLKTELPSLRTALLEISAVFYSLLLWIPTFSGIRYLATNFGLGAYLPLAPMPPDTLYYSFQWVFVSVTVSVLWQQECLHVFVTFVSPVPGMVPGSKLEPKKKSWINKRKRKNGERKKANLWNGLQISLFVFIVVNTS